MRAIKSDFEKTRDKHLRAIKKAVLWLKADNYTIEVQETETMLGTVVNHIYARLRSKLGGTLFEQKYLFTLDEYKNKEE